MRLAMAQLLAQAGNEVTHGQGLGASAFDDALRGDGWAQQGNDGGSQVDVLARSTFLLSLLSLLVVIFGFGILGFSTHGTTITTGWVLSSLILYVIALGLSLFGVVPALRTAAATMLRAS